MRVGEQAVAALSRGVAAWNALAARTRMIALAGTGVFVIALVAWLFAGGRPCGERPDVEARVATLSASLQAEAAAGKISIEELASRIKRLNAAATAFEASKDLPKYCEALDLLGEEFEPARN
jgi:type II secretory pathway component PulM